MDSVDSKGSSHGSPKSHLGPQGSPNVRSVMISPSALPAPASRLYSSGRTANGHCSFNLDQMVVHMFLCLKYNNFSWLHPDVNPQSRRYQTMPAAQRRHTVHIMLICRLKRRLHASFIVIIILSMATCVNFHWYGEGHTPRPCLL